MSNTETEPELKPCPFCGQPNVSLQGYTESRVQCASCGAEGPPGDRSVDFETPRCDPEESAVQYWNEQVSIKAMIDRKQVRWLLSNDTGLSSITLWCFMTDMPCPDPRHPNDDDDLGRCVRLLNLFPNWWLRLGDIREKYPDWEPWISRAFIHKGTA